MLRTRLRRKYIGSTTRALHTPARQHAYAMKHSDDTSALGEHSKIHTEAMSASFNILDRASDLLCLRIQEAYWIQRRQPTLNRKEETMGTGFLV